MKLNHVLGLAGLAVMTGAAAAQFGGQPGDPQFDGKRLQGQWVVDWDLTLTLQPPRTLVPPKLLEFRGDEKILALMLNEPRFKGHKIYIAGWMSATDMKAHPFGVVSDGGPVPHMVVMSPTRSDPIGEVVKWDFNMVLAAKPAYDQLFFGGDVPRESLVAYDRLIR